MAPSSIASSVVSPDMPLYNSLNMNNGTMQTYYAVFETKLGWMGLAGSEAGLRRVLLPQPFPQAVSRLLAMEMPGAVLDSTPLGDLPNRFMRYFRGEPVTFGDKLDFAGATPFTRAVWEATRFIPYGQTQSYSWVAQQIGRPLARRAVGQALSRNLFPIIVPCHRVVGQNGSLRGFSAGLEMKKRLLDLEASGPR